MDDDIPVIVRMRVECARCGHAEDETFEFDMPRDNSEPMEEYVPGTCPGLRCSDSHAFKSNAAAAVVVANIRAGEITVRRAICKRFPAGRERDA